MQEVSPFVRSGNYDGKAIVDFSRSIFNNTIYKMIMNLDRPAINDLVSGKLVNLNENEQEAIFRFTQGQGLLLRAKDKYSVSVTVYNDYTLFLKIHHQMTLNGPKHSVPYIKNMI